MTDARHDDAVTALLRELARVQRHHDERAANPQLARALLYLGTWQSRRLRGTYADLEATPRYATAMQFFEAERYGGADFAQRDADLARVVPAMKRVMPGAGAYGRSMANWSSCPNQPWIGVRSASGSLTYR